MKKGLWTPDEDLRLIKHIKIHGEGNWRTLSMKAGLRRCGKACRLRWMNYLRPDIKRGHISQEEEEMILRLHKLLGNRWSLIAGSIPDRTDNEIKNHWNSHLSKRAEAIELQPAHKQPSSEDNNDSPISRIEETAHSLSGTKDVYNVRSYASQDAVEPRQSFKKISDGYDAFAAIDDFSNIISDVGGAPWSYGDRPSPSMAMPCNLPPLFIPPMGILAGYENIVENISNAEHLAGSESNMQLCSTLLRAECGIQIPSCRDEIDDAFAVDYDNSVEPMQNFKQIGDDYDALAAINDFSIVFDNMGGAPWCYGDRLFSSMALPCNSPTPFISTMGTSAGYENITDNINNAEHLVGSESNMQLSSTLLRAECHTQIPSCGEEIDDAFTVDYDNMGEAKKGIKMYANSSTTIAEWSKPFSALSDWLDAPSDYILSIEDCC